MRPARPWYLGAESWNTSAAFAASKVAGSLKRTMAVIIGKIPALALMVADIITLCAMAVIPSAGRCILGEARHLGVERLFEGGAIFAPKAVELEHRAVRYHCGGPQDPQDRGHEQVRGGEAMFEIVSSAQLAAKAIQPLFNQTDDALL